MDKNLNEASMHNSNDVISLLTNHRSIRKFTDEAVSSEQLATIIEAAQMASTSSNVQAYSIINVTDPQLRHQVMELSGNQTYVEAAPTFLVWCADLQRLAKVSQKDSGNVEEQSYIDTMENLLVATIDTALAAQNAAIAAESLQLGIVYIGGVRNNSEALSQLLQLPDLVFPLFGMCIGKPAQQPILRPRLPKEAILFENKYCAEQMDDSLLQYDQAISAYMNKRSDGKVDTNWSEQMKKRLQAPVRLHMKSFLERRGFMKR
ncbi:oxygen-insensitive NADPH nitroreductase [Paenibacillus yanchengensis]|uniref:Oxygen-insensitive NADPH nitroreductase n=1 Tax=Paenibacillus yanchengensis TaxID=2035833 RepID=A0ABW4YLV0_9BACL